MDGAVLALCYPLFATAWPQTCPCHTYCVSPPRPLLSGHLLIIVVVSSFVLFARPHSRF